MRKIILFLLLFPLFSYGQIVKQKIETSPVNKITARLDTFGDNTLRYSYRLEAGYNKVYDEKGELLFEGYCKKRNRSNLQIGIWLSYTDGKLSRIESFNRKGHLESYISLKQFNDVNDIFISNGKHYIYEERLTNE